MFNFMHNILSKFYFRKPSVHYIQPKSLNIRFKESSDYTWINLQNIVFMKPIIEQIKEENTNSFLLKIDVREASGQVNTLEVAKFETRAEAQSALNLLISKMHGPEKSVIKFSLVVLLLIFMWGLAIDMFFVSNRNLNIAKSASNQAMTQTITQPPSNQARAPNLNPNGLTEEQSKVLSDLQKQANANMGNAGNVDSPPAPTIEESQNPAAQSLINGLGK